MTPTQNGVTDCQQGENKREQKMELLLYFFLTR